MFKAGITVMMLLVVIPAQAQLDDPTRPPGYRLVLPGGKQARGAHYDLQAVRISAEQKVAMINGRYFREGQWVSGAQLMDIQSAYVTLQKNGKRFDIRLVTNNVDKTLSNQTGK